MAVDFGGDGNPLGISFIGVALALIHLISIPVTNISANPARSTAVAVFAGASAISQLWLFWVAPILGGWIGGMAYKWLGNENPT